MKLSAFAVFFCLAAPAAIGAADLDRGLVTAVDRIGGNLLGPAAFDAVLFDPQPDPPRLRLYLSAEQTHPVEVVLVTAPGELNPPDPVRAFFRMTVGGPEGVKLEFDPNAGEIIPCVVPEDDLRVIGAAPLDGSALANFRGGLVTALNEVGESIFGGSGFEAVAFDPQPDPPQPTHLRLFVSRANPLEIAVMNPAASGRPMLHMVLGGPEVTLQGDPDAGGLRLEARIVEADLSALGSSGPVPR
jgi:hypothetical protein